MKIETPRGVVVQNGNGSARLVWNKDFVPDTIRRFTKCQKFVDNEVLRLSQPMVPFQSGMLLKSGTLGTLIGSGEVEYIAPYARYQYYGKLMVGRAPKTLTSRNLTYAGAPRRGALWFERMKAQHLGRILSGAAKILKEE